MKKSLLLLILVLFLACSTDENIPLPEPAPIFVGDVVLHNQIEVDDFGAMGFVEITGKLEIIREFETTAPILSLASLSTLEIVGGDLQLINLYELRNLEGLNNLNSISGKLYLYSLTEVNSLEVFSDVNSTITSLEINFLRGLTNLNGLENINITSGGDLIIEGNDQLENLDAIQAGLPTVLGSARFDELVFQTCSSCTTTLDPVPQPFTSFRFMENVTNVEWMKIKGFVGEDLNGLENVTSIERLSLWRNPNLTSLAGLSGVTSDIEGTFIVENASLISLDGLENVSSFNTRLFISYNESLRDFCALQNNLSTSFEPDQFAISDNVYNPSLQDIIDGNCSN